MKIEVVKSSRSSEWAYWIQTEEGETIGAIATGPFADRLAGRIRNWGKAIGTQQWADRVEQERAAMVESA